jgi:hypothetical protein
LDGQAIIAAFASAIEELVGALIPSKSSSHPRTLAQRDPRRWPARDRRHKCHAKAGLLLNEHIDQPGDVVFRHACKMGLEGIVSKRLGSPYRSGRSRHWIKSKNPKHPAVKREAEEDWGR